ncbi:MAG: hypothetical protein WA553_03170 [Methylocella sp.]
MTHVSIMVLYGVGNIGAVKVQRRNVTPARNKGHSSSGALKRPIWRDFAGQSQKINRRVSASVRRPQDLFCPRFIPLHLHCERRGRSEFRLGPDPAASYSRNRRRPVLAGRRILK